MNMIMKRRIVSSMLLAVLPCGSIGGICGVNTALPEPHRRPHSLRRQREKLCLRKKLLHRPKKTECIERSMLI